MRNRNLSFPAVSLPAALDKLKILHVVCGRSEISHERAFVCWGYTPSSRVGIKLVAALESFGLINSIEVPGRRRLKISKVALRDLFSQQATERHRSNAIQAFTLAPVIYQVVWDRWGDDLPDNDELSEFLVDEIGFKQKLLPQFTNDYLVSIEFAKLHGLVDQTVKSGKDDTDLDFSGDDVEIKFPTSHKYPWLEDDTDTNLELETVDLPLKRDWLGSDLQLDEEDISLEIIEFGDGDEASLVVTERRLQLSTSRTKSEVRATREIGCFPVASNCNFYLTADGPIDRGTFEALIAQLSLHLEIGDLDPGDDT